MFVAKLQTVTSFIYWLSLLFHLLTFLVVSSTDFPCCFIYWLSLLFHLLTFLVISSTDFLVVSSTDFPCCFIYWLSLLFLPHLQFFHFRLYVISAFGRNADEILLTVEWLFHNDVSGHPLCPITWIPVSWRWNRYSVPKRRYGSTTLSCVIFMKSGDLSFAFL